MVVVGSMIGSGIFIVSADMARTIGSPGWLLGAWVLTGLLTVVGALSYGELAAMMPRAGGQYVYLREAFSPLWGFLYGWTLFLVIQTGTIAAVSVGICDGVVVLDLDYDEDSQAETDMNVVMNNGGGFVEVQGTAEGHAFRRHELDALLNLAAEGIGTLFALQAQALKRP